VTLNLLPALTVVGLTLTSLTVGITLPSSLVTLNSAVEDAMGFDVFMFILSISIDLQCGVLYFSHSRQLCWRNYRPTVRRQAWRRPTMARPAVNHFDSHSLEYERWSLVAPVSRSISWLGSDCWGGLGGPVPPVRSFHGCAFRIAPVSSSLSWMGSVG